MKVSRLIPLFVLTSLLFFSERTNAQTTVTLGAGSSSSSTRGPFQRSDTASSTVFSRFVHIYTAAELSAVGMTGGTSITALHWELASSNVIIGIGDATLKVYIKNSTATEAVSDSWDNHIAGSDLVVDDAFNATNNFPGANGWMPFTFTAPFNYDGGALEIAVDWDCSQVSAPAFSGDGALKWRWESVAPDFLVVKKTSSSAPSTDITDLKDERANIQIVYDSAIACELPSDLSAATTSTTGDFTWTASSTATSYNWLVVLTGDGVGGASVDSGNSASTSASTSSLDPLTGYDLFVESDCGVDGVSGYEGPLSFATTGDVSNTITIGLGTSSSSTRGPFQRSDTASSTVFSRFVHIYTAAELATNGLTTGDLLTSVEWDLASDNVIIGDGDALLQIYIKNSSATEAMSDSWDNHIAGSSLVVDNDYNTGNNFPGTQGWMPFSFNAPFEYTGDAIEIAVNWDCSQVSTPAFSGDGSLKWRYESTAPDSLVVKRTSSSSPSTTISDLKDERANIQLVYSGMGTSCVAATGLAASNITEDSAQLSWDAVGAAMSYNWIVVAEGDGSGGTTVDSGAVTDAMAAAAGLTPNTSYDLFVEVDCGGGSTSDFTGPITFMTDMVDNLDQIEMLTSLSIVPNPSKGITQLTIELTDKVNLTMSIFAVNGALVAEYAQNNVQQLNHTFDLTSFDNGLYFLQLTVDNQVLTRKIIIQK